MRSSFIKYKNIAKITKMNGLFPSPINRKRIKQRNNEILGFIPALLKSDLVKLSFKI